MTNSDTKTRIDSLLAERGLFPSRSQAAAAVMAGEVLVGAERVRSSKPGQLVSADVEITVDQKQRFVSRGGVKLSNALEHLDVDCVGKRALDVGASTGGFTDCLLQNGAKEVIALDVAYGELAWSIREDPRVTVMERTNIRSVTSGMLPWQPELVVCDVSFIGLGKVLPAVFGLVDGRFDVLAMVKPQFEVGRERVGKGGVVRDPEVRREAILNVGNLVQEMGHSVMGFASSGLPGPKGNLETFIHIAEGDRPGSLGALDESATMVES